MHESIFLFDYKHFKSHIRPLVDFSEKGDIYLC